MSKNSYQEIIVYLSNQDAEILSKYLEEYHIENLVGYYEILYEEENINFNTRKKLLFYFLPDDKQARWEIETLLLTLNIQDYFIEDHIIEFKDYWEEYKNTFKPFKISPNFYLIPIWHKDSFKIEPHFYPIYIEPGIAFGTGLHPSTQLMIEWIDSHPMQDTIVLDAGCGSGILTIASLRKKARKVISFDIDINAIESTKKNLQYNHFEHLIDSAIILIQGSWDYPLILEENYNIVLANMTLPVFLKYQNIIQNIKTKILVISGIGIDQIEEISNLFNNYYKIHNILQKEEWAAIEFIKI